MNAVPSLTRFLHWSHVVGPDLFALQKGILLQTLSGLHSGSRSRTAFSISGQDAL